MLQYEHSSSELFFIGRWPVRFVETSRHQYDLLYKLSSVVFSPRAGPKVFPTGHKNLINLMRIYSALLILRLVLITSFPQYTQAQDSQLFDTPQTKTNIAQTAETQETIGHSIHTSILTAQSPTTEELLFEGSKRGKILKQRLEAYEPPKDTLKILVTGYSSTIDQCDADPFTTASGTRVHRGTMACPAQYPFGTQVVIENMGTFVCEDRGGAIKGNHFDMWFSTRGAAKEWGKQYVLADIRK